MIRLTVEVWRGAAVESSHRVHAVVYGTGPAPGGGPEAGALLTYWRSAMKPFQAVPLLADGVATGLGYGPQDIALWCASHGGMPQHTDRVAAMLERLHLDEDDLHCGPHAPFDTETAQDLACRGERPRRLHNNCSGKHAGMLALCRHRGWSHRGYERPDHPVQQRIRASLAEWMDVEPENHEWALDGCGVPTPLVRLAEMARAYSRLVIRAREGHLAAAGVVAAMTKHPEFTSSPGRLPLAVMRATDGRILCKEGAEGVLCAAAVDDDWGLALKVEDGSMRAAGPAATHILASAGLLRGAEVEALAPLSRAKICNTLGEPVGEIMARPPLGPPGGPEP